MPTQQIGDQLVHWRAEGDAPVLYLHGVPNSSEMWAPFQQRSGGVAVDLPGFGRSGKRADADYGFRGLARFVGAFADHLGWERIRLCMHDWGAVGLLWALEHPERVERLVLLDAVPFLPGYRWHMIARQWRRRFVGELAMGLTTPFVARRLVPRGVAEEMGELFDHGTQRAILRLYRSAPEAQLAEAGSGLGVLAGVDAMVLWGARDPYISASFAGAYAEALGGARVEIGAGAGHWPWFQRPDFVNIVTDFLLR